MLFSEQACARWSDRLICLSDDLGQELQDLGIGQARQWQTIRLGLELDDYGATTEQRYSDRERLRHELGLPPQTPLIGVVARLAPVKGIKFLLDGAPRILNSAPDAHFIIAGDGPTRTRLEEQTRAMGLEARVHFLGMRADVGALYRALDCVVLPSLQEGTPVSLIEALAAGAPVVASAVGGVPLLVQQERTGLLVAPRDSEALAGAVARILGSPEVARRFGEEGRAQMHRDWSIGRLVEDHRALYARLGQEKGLIAR